MPWIDIAANPRDEASYQAARADELLWRRARALSISRRRLFQLVAMGVSSVLLPCGWPWHPRGAQAASPGDLVLKLTPPELFFDYGSNQEMRWEQLYQRGYVVSNELFFVRNHTPYGQNNQTRLSTKGCAPAIACSSTCIPVQHRPYSLPMWAEKAEVERVMGWKKLLAYITGSVDQELLLRNEYLVTENRLLRQQITGRVRLTDGERKTLAEIGKRLGKRAMEEVATIVKPETILAWHRTLVTQKFDGSKQRKALGRPRTDKELETLVVRMARGNRTWGYDRIAGALAHLGYTISDQTVGNILKRHGILPAPERKKTTTWKEFIRAHMDVLVATDFFTTEVWTWCGLVTYYVLFFIRISTREVYVEGVTPHPDQPWVVQVARNVTMADWGFLTPGQYLIHDRDGKFCPAFQQMIDEAGVTRAPLPPRSPNLNPYAERFVRSVKDEMLSRLILFGERSLRHALTQYDTHYHTERPHQGLGNAVLLPAASHSQGRDGPVRCQERLGGLLKYYYREAA